MPHGDGEPRASFVNGETCLAGTREQHGVGFPMAGLLACGDVGGAIMDRDAAGLARPSALGAPAALVFGAG